MDCVVTRICRTSAMKLLVVGLGAIGQRHVRNIRALLGGQVEILAHRVRKLSHVITDGLEIEAGTTIEQKYGIQTFAELDLALAQMPDAVLVCNPSSLHLQTAWAAAKAGCHLFVEKPLSHTYEGVDALIELVEANGVVAVVGYQFRFHPCLQRLRSLLVERAIGHVVAVRVEVGEFLRGWHRYEDYQETYAARRELGGGVLLSQIHEFDYLYWLFGLPRRVFALGGHLSSLDVDVEDVAAVSLEYWLDGKCLPVQVHMDYVQRPPSRTCAVFGDRGKILVDFNALTIQHFDDGGALVENTSLSDFQRNQLFLDELKHFFACIEGRESPAVSLRDGAQSLRIALAAKQSLDSGQVIELTAAHQQRSRIDV